jgi:hypothetical protein
MSDSEKIDKKLILSIEKGICHSKIGAIFANTSAIIEAGTLSNLRALREFKSKARGWSQRIMPVVLVTELASDTANPAVRAKLPPLVIGTTIGN